VGLLRTNNEDALLVLPDAGLVAVLDGLGGHAGGEVASSVAAQSLTEDLGGSGEPDLAGALERAHRRVLDRAATDRSLSGMGTTAVVARLRGTTVHLAHVGDSRAYVVESGRLRPVTTDHQVAGYITQALGASPTVAPDVVVLELAKGDLLLLCTDGLTNMVADPEIEGLLRTSMPGGQEDPQQGVDVLVQAALDRGGIDNVTVVLVVV
jgi:protein phosphatase